MLCAASSQGAAFVHLFAKANVMFEPWMKALRGSLDGIGLPTENF
jgi:hypothetical protein